MDEYRDLPMTVAAFVRVLDEDEFSAMKAGIVLQAYLPASHYFFGELVTWAKVRYKIGWNNKGALSKGYKPCDGTCRCRTSWLEPSSVTHKIRC